MGEERRTGQTFRRTESNAATQGRGDKIGMINGFLKASPRTPPFPLDQREVRSSGSSALWYLR
jgi:hypothetical protein